MTRLTARGRIPAPRPWLRSKTEEGWRRVEDDPGRITFSIRGRNPVRHDRARVPWSGMGDEQMPTVPRGSTKLRDGGRPQTSSTHLECLLVG